MPVLRLAAAANVRPRPAQRGEGGERGRRCLVGDCPSPLPSPRCAGRGQTIVEQRAFKPFFGHPLRADRTGWPPPGGRPAGSAGRQGWRRAHGAARSRHGPGQLPAAVGLALGAAGARRRPAIQRAVVATRPAGLPARPPGSATRTRTVRPAAADGADQEGALGPQVVEGDVLPPGGQGREDAQHATPALQQHLVHRLGGGQRRLDDRARLEVHGVGLDEARRAARRGSGRRPRPCPAATRWPRPPRRSSPAAPPRSRSSGPAIVRSAPARSAAAPVTRRSG